MGSKTTLKAAGGVVIAAGILGGAVAKDPFSVSPFDIPEQYQSELSDYRSNWDRLTGFEYSGLHWEQFIVVYINKDSDVYKYNFAEYERFYQDNDEDEVDEDAQPNFRLYSPGTIVLKENFSGESGSPDTPISITMMIKHKPGYDSRHGDWEYVQFAPDGQLIMNGKATDPVIQSACSGCHINMESRDYIFANYYSKAR